MKKKFTRYALYFLPSDGSELQKFGDSWLGWSVSKRQAIKQPRIGNQSLSVITKKPRKYGFHGTLKAPFQLADGVSENDLITTAKALVDSIQIFQIPALQIARLGSFLALVPQQPCVPLQQLASSLVRELDNLRAPLSDAELKRRRASGLTPAQDALLTKWGYPFVMDEFRFHLTLSDKLQADELQRIKAILQSHTSHLTRTPVGVDDVGLVGEAGDGRFHLIRRLPLAAVKS